MVTKLALRSLRRSVFPAIHQVLLWAGILSLVLAPLVFIQSAAAKPAAWQYANQITLAPGAPLPIYHISSIEVNSDVTSLLSREFNGIFQPDNFDVREDQYIGHSRFTGMNETQGTILEQFGATGGFYAYDFQRAFGDGSVVPTPMLDPRMAQQLACGFVLTHLQTLQPDPVNLTVPGIDVSCDVNFSTDPLYSTSIETITEQSAAPGKGSSDTPIRILVRMPILVNTEMHAQIPQIPLGGPGGHISLIFADTNPDSFSPTIDSNIVGLQAVAMPAHGRSLMFDRLVPAVDPTVAMDQVLQQLMEAFPNGSDFHVPEPSLEYYMTDAAEPQSFLEPKLIFTGVSVNVGGQTLVLKDIVLPGVESGPGGVGPTIMIHTPQDGDRYFPHAPVNLYGSISDGQPPYMYDWQLDDGTSLGGGALNAPGDLPVLQADLPVPANKGSAGNLTVRLVVTDDEGATRQQAVSLDAPLSLYVPVILNGSSGTASFAGQSSAPAALTPNAVNYSFGVEYGSDYPPYGSGGPDLGGVPGDANGLSSGLWSLGWPRVFNWYNSLAWERDWRDCGLGGSDCTYGVDRADFVYYSGHGSNGGIAVPSNSHDSGWFDGINARYQQARWVGFSSCLTLRAQWSVAGSEPIRRWFNAFQGAHMLLGFNSTMGDIAFGPRLVDNMRIPSFWFIGELPWAQRTIAEAWVQTAFEMNAGKPAYIYATSPWVNPVGNKLPKVGDPLMPRPYPVNWYYWVWWNE